MNKFVCPCTEGCMEEQASLEFNLTFGDVLLFCRKFSETKIFRLEISQIFCKNWWVQNFQIFVRKFFRTQLFVDRIKPWLGFLEKHLTV